MRARLLRSRLPHLLESQDREEEEDASPEDQGKADEPRQDRGRGRIAFVADLDRMPTMGEGSELWRQLVPGDLDAGWLVKAAALSDLAVLLSSRAENIAAAAVTLKGYAIEKSIARPQILAGPFSGPDKDVDFLWTYVDGLVLVPETDEPETEIQAEMLRRQASTIGETLMLSRASWNEAPSICLMAPLDVLSIMPPGCCEWMLLRDPPDKPFARWAQKLVVCRGENFEWWMGDYSTVGPDSVWWRAWMRHPMAAG